MARRLIEDGNKGIFEAHIRVVFRTESEEQNPEIVLDALMADLERDPRVARLAKSEIWELSDEDD